MPGKHAGVKCIECTQNERTLPLALISILMGINGANCMSAVLVSMLENCEHLAKVLEGL